MKTAGLDATKALFAELKIKPTIANLPMARPLPFGGEQRHFNQALTQLADDAAFSRGDRLSEDDGRAAGHQPSSRRTSSARSFAIDSRRSPTCFRSRMYVSAIEFLGVQQFRMGTGRRRRRRLRSSGIFRRPSRSRKTAVRTSASILDVWHWHHSGSTIDDILAAGKDRIVHVHVSDAKAQPPEEVRDNQRVMPGEGVINLVGFFQALKKIGYDGGVSPEPLGRVPQEMSPEEGAKLALDTTLAVMKKAGVV